MNLTSYDKGVLKGREEGLELGQRKAMMLFLQRCLEKRFETAGRQFFDQLPGNLDSKTLNSLYDAALTETNLENLKKFLP